MKLQIKAALTFDVDIDEQQTSIETVAEQMELSFSVPDGCKMEIVDNEFVVLDEDGQS